MATANVIISFEAASGDEAKALIDGWTLHEGCSVSASIVETGPPSMTDEGGAIVRVPEPEQPQPEQPARSANRSEWDSYAILRELDPTEYATKDELIAAVETLDES